MPGITKKDRPLTSEHFTEFVRCYGPEPNGRSPRNPADSPADRWRRFHISEVQQKGFKIDGLHWLKDDSLDDPDDLPEPEELVTDAIAELEGAIQELNSILSLIENGNSADASQLEAETL